MFWGDSRGLLQADVLRHVRDEARNIKVIIVEKSFSLHLILFLLGLAKRNVLLSCLLVEASPAAVALGVRTSFGRLEDLSLFLRWLVVITPCVLYPRTKLQRLCLPLGDFLIRLLLLQLFLDHLALLHQLLLLVCDQPLLQRIEFLPLLLEDLPADALVLLDAVGVELPPALPALDQLIRTILLDLSPVLTVDFLYALLFEPRLFLREDLLTCRYPNRGLVPISSLIVGWLLVVLRGPLGLTLVGRILLVVRVLVGTTSIACSAHALPVIIPVLIVVAAKIYLEEELLLRLGFPRG